MRLAVVQRFLPHYRVGFFAELARLIHERGGQFRLFYSHTIGRLEALPVWATRLRALRADLRLGELDESAIFAPALSWHLGRFAPDVAVLEDLAGLPNSLVGATYCRWRGTPYLIWGLGSVPQKERSFIRRALAPAISFLYEGASAFVCYSTYAAEVYQQTGKPTFVAPNSYLSRPTPADVAARRKRIVDKTTTRELTVIAIGTLKRQKRVDVLIEALARHHPDVRLEVIGDGTDRERLEALARDLGLGQRVRFHGPLYEGQQKEGLLAAAHIGVVPGRGGLAIQELLAHGIPVISGVADGTERDLIQDGVNGYLLDGFPTAADLAKRLAVFMSLSAAQQTAMCNAALDVVVERSNIEMMAQGMLQAADYALARVPPASWRHAR